MAVRFGLYYFSEIVGDYLQRVINASPLGVVSQATLIMDALPLPEPDQADAWIIEYDETVADMEPWLERIQDRLTEPFLVLYLREADTATLLKALRLGVQQCFVGEIQDNDLNRTIQRLLKTKRPLQENDKTQIVALLGVKGGLGVTFLALNLAQALVGLKQSTLVLDLDFAPAGLASAVEMKPRYTILDVINNFDRWDPQYIKDAVHVLPDGLRVLPGLSRLEDFDLVQPQHVEKLLHYLRVQQLFRWVVIDLGDSLHELTLKSLEQAYLILLVTCLTVPGLKAAQKVLEVLDLLQLDDKRLRLLVNAYERKKMVTPEEGEKYLNQKFLAVLQYDPAPVWHSLNEGRPLVAQQPQHRLVTQICSLAKTLLGPETESSKKFRWLPAFWQRRQ